MTIQYQIWIYIIESKVCYTPSWRNEVLQNERIFNAARLKPVAETAWGGEASPVEENHLDVNVLPVLVEEVLQEVRHRLIGDVATDHNVPGKNTKSLEISGFCNVLDRHAPCTTCKVQTLKTKRKLVNFLKARNNDETGKAEGHITQRSRRLPKVQQNRTIFLFPLSTTFSSSNLWLCSFEWAM